MIICGYCKSDNSNSLYSTYDIFSNNYLIHKCNVCHSYFLFPRPDELLLIKAYNPSYYGESGEDKFIPIIENFVNYFRSARARHFNKIFKIKNKESKNKIKVLDIGCGNGGFLSNLSKYGKFELYGTELDGNSAKRAAHISDVKLKIGNLEKNDFTKETFDAITLFHVFEHLTEPKEMLEIISGIIKQNGILIVSFPNIGSIQSKLFKGHWFHMDPPRHLFFMTPKDFIALMKTFGFKLIRSKYYSFEQNPYGTVQSILNMLCKKREVLYERLKGNYKYAPEYSRLNILFQLLFFLMTFPIFALTDIFSNLFKTGATVEFTFRKQ